MLTQSNPETHCYLGKASGTAQCCVHGLGLKGMERRFTFLFCSFRLFRDRNILPSPKSKNEILWRHFANWSLNNIFNKNSKDFDINSEMKHFSDSALETRPWVQSKTPPLIPKYGHPSCLPKDKRQLPRWGPAGHPTASFPLSPGVPFPLLVQTWCEILLRGCSNAKIQG